MHRIDVRKLADESKFNRFHALVLFWGVLILILDGYDLAVVLATLVSTFTPFTLASLTC